MSIKPIDSQISFTNSLHESKDKQNDMNRSKISHQFTENKQQTEIKNKQTQVQNNEETKSKQFGENDKNHSNQQFNKKRHKKQSKNHDQVDKFDHRGKKIDLRI
ncbi:hypothetical protein Amet_2692 [Alkaliphilus metalliredigens QYMF]|uniref:Uncharacterized protein n=1 Tax=Alkaliphilus metalliredigens (strain QYMF) TaxID=293826 RepID=A6TRM6_ALKMQ|nr:hypothetical protein [Alkaliphilus metalliredigens]ABR48844.1 hypothetical protein Amet_2692 [Alkaliphilus metalliredigens QYMF]